ncbi:MAG: ABC transporter, permease protein 2 (cluster 5, nickel/peptides/opines), partial [uncultured Thermomicrobiales bacterium]
GGSGLERPRCPRRSCPPRCPPAAHRHRLVLHPRPAARPRRRAPRRPLRPRRPGRPLPRPPRPDRAVHRRPPPAAERRLPPGDRRVRAGHLLPAALRRPRLLPGRRHRGRHRRRPRHPARAGRRLRRRLGRQRPDPADGRPLRLPRHPAGDRDHLAARQHPDQRDGRHRHRLHPDLHAGRPRRHPLRPPHRLRRGGGRPRGADATDPRPPRAAEHHRPADRPRLAQLRLRGAGRGVAGVPRPRQQAARPLVGVDGLGLLRLPPVGALGRHRAGGRDRPRRPRLQPARRRPPRRPRPPPAGTL